MTAYVGGAQTASLSDWRKTVKFTNVVEPDMALFIEATNNGGVKGIGGVATVSPYVGDPSILFTTAASNSWKCQGLKWWFQFQNNWRQNRFDDSSWPRANETDGPTTAPGGAKWIWADDKFKYAACRYDLGYPVQVTVTGLPTWGSGMNQPLLLSLTQGSSALLESQISTYRPGVFTFTQWVFNNAAYRVVMQRPSKYECAFTTGNSQGVASQIVMIGVRCVPANTVRFTVEGLCGTRAVLNLSLNGVPVLIQGRSDVGEVTLMMDATLASQSLWSLSITSNPFGHTCSLVKPAASSGRVTGSLNFEIVCTSTCLYSKFAADDIARVYLNEEGVLSEPPNTGIFTFASVTDPSDVLAIHVQNAFQSGSLIGRVDINSPQMCRGWTIRTNKEWKCAQFASAPPPSWMNEDFNDADWPSAVELWGWDVKNFFWSRYIWGASNKEGFQGWNIFCRLRLGRTLRFAVTGPDPNATVVVRVSSNRVTIGDYSVTDGFTLVNKVFRSAELSYKVINAPAALSCSFSSKAVSSFYTLVTVSCKAGPRDMYVIVNGLPSFLSTVVKINSISKTIAGNSPRVRYRGLFCYTNYYVTASSPAGYVCTPTPASGVLTVATTVTVNCELIVPAERLRLVIVNQPADSVLGLSINGVAVAITGTGEPRRNYTYATLISGRWVVAVQSNPPGYMCAVSPGTGVSNSGVVPVVECFPSLQAISVTVRGLCTSDPTVTVSVTGNNPVVLSAGATSAVLPNGLMLGATINVTITSPPGYRCRTAAAYPRPVGVQERVEVVCGEGCLSGTAYGDDYLNAWVDDTPVISDALYGNSTTISVPVTARSVFAVWVENQAPTDGFINPAGIAGAFDLASALDSSKFSFKTVSDFPWKCIQTASINSFWRSYDYNDDDWAAPVYFQDPNYPQFEPGRHPYLNFGPQGSKWIWGPLWSDDSEQGRNFYCRVQMGYSVRVTFKNLVSQGPYTLSLWSSQTQLSSLSSDAISTVFPDNVLRGQDYSVQLDEQPPNHFCVVAGPRQAPDRAEEVQVTINCKFGATSAAELDDDASPGDDSSSNALSTAFIVAGSVAGALLVAAGLVYVYRRRSAAQNDGKFLRVAVDSPRNAKVAPSPMTPGGPITPPSVTKPPTTPSSNSTMLAGII